MSKGPTGKIFDIQGFSVHDGPGIRLTLFFKGCPLRCPWCHSPESQEFFAELNWMEIKCIGTELCGNCLTACPSGAISPSGIKTSPANGHTIQLVEVDRQKCNNCGQCAAACTPKALYMCGTDYTPEQIMERIRQEVPFLRKSGGGVTFSGGECLYQSVFLLEILKRCKSEGIHTAVDTTGFAPWDSIKSILPYTDLFLYDLKNMDSKMHKRVIGVPNELILENVRKIAAFGGKLQIRIPIIPLFNDSKKAFADIGRFLLELGPAVEVVQLLPYHQLGVAKWNRLQRNTSIFIAEPHPEELIQERKKQLENMGLKVIIH